jgi:hypothetical protein
MQLKSQDIYPPNRASDRAGRSSRGLPPPNQAQKPARKKGATASLRIAPLDRELLVELYAAGYMRTDQIERMLRLIATRERFPLHTQALRRVVQKRLLQWYRAGIVRRIAPPIFADTRSGPPFFIYTLDKAGAAVVAEHLGLTWDELGWRRSGEMSLLFLNHTLQMTSVKLMLTEAGLREDVALADWIDDRLLRQAPARVNLEGAGGERLRVSVVPDAYFQLKLPNGNALACCFEMDLGTSTVAPRKWQARAWRRKMLAYRRLLESRPAAPGWAAAPFVVTTCTTSITRMAHLRRVCEAAGGDQRFWFTHLDTLNPNTILTAPVWSVAGQGDTQHRLLPRR